MSSIISNLRESSLTFRKCTGEKIAFIVLNWFDLALTMFAVSTCARELNPLMRNMFDSPVFLYAAKLIIPMFLAWALPGKFLWPSIGLLILVTGWNIKELVIYYF